jgi:rod shape determining protein RodA
LRVQKNNIFFGIDLTLVFLYLLLVVFGWMNIYAASITSESHEVFDFSTKYGKQMIWIGMSIALMIVLLFIDAKAYEKFAPFIYIICIISLIGLFVLGKKINGATSWYDFGGFSLQPSEFAKVGTVLALGKLLNDNQYDLKIFKNQMKAFVILFLPAVLITLQPDPGSALIYVSFFFVLYREGLPIYYIAVGITVIVLFIITLAFGFTSVITYTYGILGATVLYLFLFKGNQLKFQWFKVIGLFLAIGTVVYSVDYVYNNIFEQRHRDRFNILLGKNSDTKGVGYNTNQSLLTIESGGITGKGFLQGDRTQGDFVPEQHTDYIFSTIGEEWGFAGTSIVVVVFTFFVLRIIFLAEMQKNTFSRVYGYGIATVFFFHYLINIGMVIGVFPTIGIPLPFFSYGGSGLWGFTVLLFIFIKLDSTKSYEL